MNKHQQKSNELSLPSTGMGCQFLHLCFHSSNMYNRGYVVLGAGDTMRRKTNEISALMEFSLMEKDQRVSTQVPCKVVTRALHM